MDETTVIKMELTDIEDMSLTTIIGSEELTTQYQVRMLAKHGKTMLMMYEATSESKYLRQARIDYHRIQSLLRGDFIRPLGVILTEVA